MACLERQLAAFRRRSEVKLQNTSDATGAVAVQGPRVVEFIARCFPGPSIGGTLVARVTDLKKNQAARFSAAGTTIWISRTGYTGEDGFEIVAPGQSIEAIWNQLFAAGQPYGLKPAGLGARDTLRTEVCYPLYGHELDETTTPSRPAWASSWLWTKASSLAAPSSPSRRPKARARSSSRSR